MKYSFIILAFALASCKQQPANNNSPSTISNSAASKVPDQTMSDSAKQALIDISSIAWLQVQAAEVALKRTHDTALLSLAQNTSKQFSRIKDKAKIVSIPYQMNMPYFLTHDQNDQVNKLNAADETTFGKEFISQVERTNQEILKQCDTFESLTKGNSDVLPFITFTRSVIDDTEKMLEKKN